MQEEPVVWDPMYEGRLPWEARIFLIYLLVVFAVLLVRSINLARQLGWFSFGKRVPTEKSDEDDTANLLARSALERTFPHAGTPEGDLAILQLADVKFRFAWQMCVAKVSSTKRLALLTFLLSLLTLTWGTIGVLADIIREKTAPVGFLAASSAEVLKPFALGVLACAALYAVSSFYEGALDRRKARWNHFCASAKGRSTSLDD